MAQSPDTKMDVTNLAKVFGPTIVAHAVPNPDPVVMLQDIKRQPKVNAHTSIACLMYKLLCDIMTYLVEVCYALSLRN